MPTPVTQQWNDAAEKTAASQVKDEWETPHDLYWLLNNEFNFTIDLAANAENKKVDRYFSTDRDALTVPWIEEVAWCNPPYSRPAKWLEKAYFSALDHNTTTVLLIPAATDTLYWWKWVVGLPISTPTNRYCETWHTLAEIRLLPGRVKFLDGRIGGTHAPIYPAGFPSAVVIYRPDDIKHPEYKNNNVIFWDWKTHYLRKHEGR